MILQVFAIHDSAVNAFCQPFFMTAVGEAKRGFIQVVNDPSTKFFKYPADYTLFHLGSYDDSNGQFTNFKTPENLGLAITFKESN